ncbi:helix-turn-helix domain-containing protein [Photobacterium damselae]|uniref:helix-turn-helix domain-containing protein n=1 Tax=Photobacterium damselae TaxID=38293 RepID=UPI0015A1522A|nr:helix-turn-helix domain-containing protein [Photobacterium damselae]NVO59507.1 hypothetical protein [Photobacterium damselae subsp. damselae]
MKFPRNQFELSKVLRIEPKQLGLKPNPKFLLLVLSSHLDAKWECFPLLNKLSAETGWSVSTVTVNMKLVLEFGLITKTKHKKELGYYANNVYRFNLDRFAELTGFQPSEPRQLLDNPSDVSQDGEADRMFIAGETLNQTQASFLLESNQRLSSIERMQIERFS